MNLSPFLYGLSEKIGLPAVMKLVDYCGGNELYVPKKLVDNHILIRLLGLEAAQKLVAAHPGESLAIALHANSSHAQQAAERRQKIRDLRERGLSHSKIAKELHTTDRTVRAVLGKEVDDRQQGLF